jgi:hypothetical protein
MLFAWVSTQLFAKDCRSFLVNVDLKEGYGVDSLMKKPPSYAPWNGEFLILVQKLPACLLPRGKEK